MALSNLFFYRLLFMFTVNAHTFEMLVEKQSKFIAHLIPYSLYDEVLSALKIEHPKARHFVTAFRYINEFDQVVEGSSDDGEPKGTSGKPTLSVLQGQELINVAVVIVRYFGGTKLGTGGLVRAYSDATNLVVSASALISYEKHEKLRIKCAYSDIGKVEYALDQAGVLVEEKQFQTLGVEMSLSAREDLLDDFTKQVERIIEIIEE